VRIFCVVEYCVSEDLADRSTIQTLGIIIKINRDSSRTCWCKVKGNETEHTRSRSNRNKFRGLKWSPLWITVEFHLSGLIGTASHPDMQKFRIVGFFFENGLHWQLEIEKKFLQTAVLVYIFIYVQIKHEYIIPYMYLKSGGKI
jgi:hypothetical protein